MSIYSNVTEQDLINLRKLAKQQKNQRTIKIKNRILKQTHDIKLAESLSPITKQLDEVKETTQNLGDIVKENNTPQLAIENITWTQSLRDTLTLMKKSKNFFKSQENPDGKLFWNKTPIIPQGEIELLLKVMNSI